MFFSVPGSSAVSNLEVFSLGLQGNSWACPTGGLVGGHWQSLLKLKLVSAIGYRLTVSVKYAKNGCYEAAGAVGLFVVMLCRFEPSFV